MANLFGSLICVQNPKRTLTLKTEGVSVIHKFLSFQFSMKGLRKKSQEGHWLILHGIFHLAKSVSGEDGILLLTSWQMLPRFSSNLLRYFLNRQVKSSSLTTNRYFYFWVWHIHILGCICLPLYSRKLVYKMVDACE